MCYGMRLTSSYLELLASYSSLQSAFALDRLLFNPNFGLTFDRTHFYGTCIKIQALELKF